ncbi:FG-GAP repeat protein [Micromonospora palomenae]|uniref:FG-GAP repeat protein n=1 Tax=Micromonospora palomenae TaxID=1461247 RepID=A0A561VH31_9ACTN|nr:FG-GAP repeat protein [Micromonospora palomenae]TWG10926.1 FG-GAP repeat protein [Micromonospora palomenae]
MTAVALFGISGEPAAYLAAGPDGVTGGVENRSDEAVSLRTARETGKPVQVKSLTSETTEVFALPDGQFRADIATGMQRFRRGGDWVPVDLTLKAAADGSVAPVAHPNDLRISGPAGPGQHELAAVGTGADRVAMGWSGALSAPVLTGNRATYVDARPGVDLVVEATRTGFEQFLVLKTRDAAAQVETVAFPFTGPGVAGANRGRDGSIAITDRSGKQTAHIPAPLMWDARKNAITGAPAAEKPVRTELTKRGDAVELTLAPDRAWLRDPATAYPVTIDPTVNPLGTTFDTWVRQTVTTDQNQQPDLQIGLLATTPATLTRSFLTWDTTVLAGKQINSATVSFWNFWSHTCTPTSWEIWTTAPSTYTTTFTNQPAWDTVGPDARSTATLGSTNCTDGWANIDGKTFFQKAATANKTRAGMGVRATDETVTAGFKQFRSREGGSAAEDPKATVTYNSWPTVTSRATVPTTSCVTGSGRPAVNTLTPQLKATVSDGDGTAMTVTFEWWAMNADTPIGSAVYSSVASGATAATTVPAGAFVDGGIYRWRVKAHDGVSGSDVWSSFCEMQVYTTVAPVTGCTGGTESDFNGDGVADVAIADPEATVNGQVRAGRVNVAYGGSTTVHTLHEGVTNVPGAAEAGDRFGTSISAYDHNNDGCTDLVVGVPNQVVGGQSYAGAVYVLLGSPAGLAQGPAPVVYHQDAANVPDSPEANDWFGYAVAGSRTASGEPYLVIGAPGEGLATGAVTGIVHYLRGGLNLAFSQGAGLPGGAEIDDRTGYAVAASKYHWAVSSPGEAIGTETFAGAVNVFNQTFVSGLPTLAAELNQNQTNVSNVSEADDNFGKSISIAPYRPVGSPAGTADSLVVVGVPGEDITVAATNTLATDAGLVHRFHVTAAKTFTELPEITYVSEDGDYLGEKVVVANTAPAAEGTTSTMFIAIGVPGEDAGETTVDAGRVRVFPALANPIGTPVTIERNGTSLPGSIRAKEIVGTSLAATSQRLLVGTPYGSDAVYGFPWSSLASGSTTPTETWRPGANGFPAGNSTFGEAIG